MKMKLAFGSVALAVVGCSQLSDPYAVAGNCPVPDHFWTSEPVYQRMERDTGERFARAPNGHYVLVGRNGDYDCARILKIAGRT